MHHPFMTFNLVAASGNVFRLICRNLTLAPVIIFVFFTEYFAICIQTIVYEMKDLTSVQEKITKMESAERRKRILKELKICNALLRLTDQMKDPFEWMLIANCLQASVMIITSSYYTLESIFDGFLVHVIWNSLDVIQFFFRVWLICYMADRLRQSVSKILYLYSIYLFDDSSFNVLTGYDPLCANFTTNSRQQYLGRRILMV
jgi:hypothetical protein